MIDARAMFHDVAGRIHVAYRDLRAEALPLPLEVREPSCLGATAYDIFEAAVVSNQLTETAELRAVRDCISRVIAFKSIRLPQEQFTLQILRVAVIVSIRKLWAKPGDVESLKVKANWSLRSLAGPP